LLAFTCTEKIITQQSTKATYKRPERKLSQKSLQIRFQVWFPMCSQLWMVDEIMQNGKKVGPWEGNMITDEMHKHTTSS
jgi:hypothetical protein